MRPLVAWWRVGLGLLSGRHSLRCRVHGGGGGAGWRPPYECLDARRLRPEEEVGCQPSAASDHAPLSQPQEAAHKLHAGPCLFHTGGGGGNSPGGYTRLVASSCGYSFQALIWKALVCY